MSDRVDTEAVRATLTAHRNLWVTHPPAPLATSALLDAAVHAADLGLALCDELDRTREALRAADDWMTYANGPYPYPTKLREQVRAVLGVQDTPEPDPTCDLCGGNGEEATPWDDNCPRAADHADRLGWHVGGPAAPQGEPERPETPPDEWIHDLPSLGEDD